MGDGRTAMNAGYFTHHSSLLIDTKLQLFLQLLKIGY